MTTVFVRPNEGARIRQPDRGGRVMPDAGDTVPRDGYYERLILSGDVVVSDPPAAPAAAPADAPAPEPKTQPAPELAPAAPSKKD